MPPSAFLPQDIIDTIVDILHESGDLKSLKACSGAARCFLHPCRRHIFASVDISANGRPYKWDPEPTGPGVDVLGERFHALLVRSPYITQYVRTLRAHARNGREAQWLTHSDELPAVLAELTHLVRLDIGARVAMRWADCTPALRSAFLSLLATSPLRTLRLQTVVGLPVSVVEQFGALHAVHLLDVPLAPPGADVPVGGGGSTSRANLRAISARGSDSVLEFLLRPTGKRTFIDYARFAFLDCQLGHHPHSYLLLSEFLEQARGLSALHCMLSASVDIPLFEAFLRHPRLPQVRHLSFHLQEPCLLPYIYAFLADLPQPCAVAEVDVLCSLFGAQDQGLSEIMNWNAISLGLHVRQLRLRFFLEQNHSTGEEQDWAESIFSSQLRPRVRDNLLALINDGRAKIFLHVIHYFGKRHFQEEMVRMRDVILKLV